MAQRFSVSLLSNKDLCVCDVGSSQAVTADCNERDNKTKQEIKNKLIHFLPACVGKAIISQSISASAAASTSIRSAFVGDIPDVGLVVVVIDEHTIEEFRDANCQIASAHRSLAAAACSSALESNFQLVSHVA
jgi:hypothetical protein